MQHHKSLMEAHYSRDLRRSFLIEAYLAENTDMSPDLLVEKKGVFKNLLVDAGQAALSGGAIVATGGAGGDVVVDVIFASKIAKDIIDEVASILDSAGEIGSIIKQAAALDFDGSLSFKSDVTDILEKVVKNKFLGDKAKEMMEQASEKVNEIISKIARAVGKWVGALIPDDFGLGGPAFQAIFSAALKKAGANAYTIALAGIKALPMEAGKYLIDSDALEDMLENISTAMLDYVNKAIETAGIDPDEDPKRWKQALAGLGAYVDIGSSLMAYPTRKGAELALKAAGKDELAAVVAPFSGAKNFAKELLPDVKKFLEKFRMDWIPMTVTVLRKLMSWLMASVVIFGELVDPSDYLEMETKKSAFDKGESRTAKEFENMFADINLENSYRGDIMKITKREVKQLVAERLTIDRIEANIMDMGRRPQGVDLDTVAAMYGSQAFDIIDLLVEDGVGVLDEEEGIFYTYGSKGVDLMMQRRGLSEAVDSRGFSEYGLYEKPGYLEAEAEFDDLMDEVAMFMGDARKRLDALMEKHVSLGATDTESMELIDAVFEEARNGVR